MTQTIYNFFKFSFSVFFFLITIAFVYTGCAQEIDDRIIITNFNKFITSADIQNGIKKSSGFYKQHVNFSHLTHEKHAKCLTCHHRNFNDERIKKCAYCHKGNPGSRTIHDFCIGCHIKQDGPQSCSGCHTLLYQHQHNDIIKVFKNTFTFKQKSHDIHRNRGVQCAECHHNTVLLRDKENSKKEKCSHCHAGFWSEKVLHELCRNCHLENKVSTNCNSCHQGVDNFYASIQNNYALEKTGSRMAQISFSHKNHIEKYHTECIDCHHNGSLKKCSSCHLKKDQGSICNLKSAFHQQCHECHSNYKGPKSCTGCHK